MEKASHQGGDGMVNEELLRATAEEEDYRPELFVQTSSRQPFTSLNQIDADLALARALQEQERAYMLLHMSSEEGEYEASGSGSYDYEYGNVAYDEKESHDYPLGQPPHEAGISNGSEEEDEYGIDGLASESDEAYARALQDAEATAHIMALAGVHDSAADEEEDDDDDINSLDAWEDVDPDNMSYEELIALGEAVGTHSRGLTAEVIDALPSSKYIQEDKLGPNTSDPCVICRVDYEDGDMLSTLPCKHHYHVDCIKSWLQINKVCPLCSVEVTS